MLRPRLFVGGLVIVSAAMFGTGGVASAHGCSHSDHYVWHSDHYDYWDYNGHFNADATHWHKWYNGSHQQSQTDACGAG